MAQTIELRGTINKIYDARAMQVDDERIGAPYKKDLADVTTGGTLAVGMSVVVQYSVRGNWKNAESIQITAAATAPQPQAAGAGPGAKGGKHSRLKPNDFRHPDEITRIDVLGHAIKTLEATGTLANAPSLNAAVVDVTKLSELYQAFVEDVIDAEFIGTQLGAKTQPESATQAADSKPEPTPAAQAAEQASVQPGPAEDESDPLASWLANG